MKTPAHDTALFLAADGATGAFGGTTGWPVYVGREPLEPENVVTVYDTGGGPNLLVDLRKPTIQVRVRGTTYESTWGRADAVYTSLVTPVNPSTDDGVTLQWVAETDILYIGRDDKDRYLVTCNFQLLRDGV